MKTQNLVRQEPKDQVVARDDDILNIRFERLTGTCLRGSRLG